MPRTRKAGHPTIKEDPDPIDLLVAKRLKQRRQHLEISQAKMAQLNDISYQQYQKYEQGINRIAASRLYRFAKTLNCDVNFFYDMDRKPYEKPETVPQDEKRLLEAYRALRPAQRPRAINIMRQLAA